MADQVLTTPPAPPAPAADTPKPDVKFRDVTELSPAQQAHWQLTGEHPDMAEMRREVRGEPAVKEAAKEAVKETPAPAPAPDKTVPIDRNPGRLSHAELRAEATRNRERIAQLERDLAESRRTPSPADSPDETEVQTDTETPPAAAANLRTRPQPGDKAADGTPKYKDWQAYEDDLLDWRDEKKQADTQAAAREQSDARFNADQIANWRARVADAKTVITDLDSAFDGSKADALYHLIQRGSMIDRWMMTSPNGVLLFHYLHTHRDALAKLQGIKDGTKAMKEITRLDDLAEQDFTAKKAAKEAPPKPAVAQERSSSAPPPIKTVDAGGEGAVDDVKRAVESGSDDARSYIDAANRKELAAKRGK